MATTNSATLKFEYADGSERSITFDDVPTSALDEFRQNVLDLNSTIEDETTGVAYKDTFVSEDGAPITRISGAKYTITETKVIYNVK